MRFTVEEMNLAPNRTAEAPAETMRKARKNPQFRKPIERSKEDCPKRAAFFQQLESKRREFREVNL